MAIDGSMHVCACIHVCMHVGVGVGEREREREGGREGGREGREGREGERSMTQDCEQCDHIVSPRPITIIMCMKMMDPHFRELIVIHTLCGLYVGTTISGGPGLFLSWG